jgi:hypothetical protein
VTDTAQARECARVIAGWKPLPPLPPRLPRGRRRPELRVQRKHGAAYWRRGKSGLRQENVAAALGHNQIM